MTPESEETAIYRALVDGYRSEGPRFMLTRDLLHVLHERTLVALRDEFGLHVLAAMDESGAPVDAVEVHELLDAIIEAAPDSLIGRIFAKGQAEALAPPRIGAKATRAH